jgi:hypothetical protein
LKIRRTLVLSSLLCVRPSRHPTNAVGREGEEFIRRRNAIEMPHECVGIAGTSVRGLLDLAAVISA